VRLWAAACIAAASLLTGKADAAPDRVWLPVVATEKTVAAAVAAADRLGRDMPLSIVSSDDCSNLRPALFLVVPALPTDRAAAEAQLAQWRDRGGVPDAYLRACEVAPDSRLAIGLPLLDPSIRQRPPETASWTVDDAVSRVLPLGNGWLALIVPHYKPEPDDAREGLRTAVRVAGPPGLERRILQPDCVGPEIAASGLLVALACAVEVAGENLLHVTRVYRLPGGEQVMVQDSCRDPELSGTRLICQGERVDADGRLHLERREADLMP
jgi:hypothetical protein